MDLAHLQNESAFSQLKITHSGGPALFERKMSLLVSYAKRPILGRYRFWGVCTL